MQVIEALRKLLELPPFVSKPKDSVGYELDADFFRREERFREAAEAEKLRFIELLRSDAREGVLRKSLLALQGDLSRLGDETDAKNTAKLIAFLPKILVKLG